MELQNLYRQLEESCDSLIEDVRTFCQAKSPRKPPTKFARDLHCKQMLMEYESAFIHLLDEADDDELLMQFISK